MSDLNHYELSQILGSKIAPIERPRFGNFGLGKIREQLARSSGTVDSSRSLGYPEDAVIVKAFEQVRDGVSPDTILWDVQLAQKFVARCYSLGLNAPPAMLKRRLLNIRKNKDRYLAHGIEISRTTKIDPNPSVVPKFAHVIEFSLLRLRYLYGASIDEILLDPMLGEEFESLASQMAPELTSAEMRLGALYIRKTRHFEKSRLQKFASLDPNCIESEWTPPLSLVSARRTPIPSKPGLIELQEGDRYLYISNNEDLRATIRQLATGSAIRLMSNQFWHPELQDIRVRFIAAREIKKTNASIWERRLIQAMRPVFNWPILSLAA